MTDSCANCFFYRNSSCQINAPEYSRAINPSTSEWPPVKSTDWCARGVDLTDFHSFNTILLTTGSFSFVAQSAIHVLNANAFATSVIQVWVAAYGAGVQPISGPFIVAPENGGFTCATPFGDVITLDCGFNIYNGGFK